MTAVAGHTESAPLVRTNFLSTLSYSILIAVVGGVFGLLASIPLAVLQQTAHPSGDVGAAIPRLPAVAVLGVAVVYVISTVIFGPLFSGAL